MVWHSIYELGISSKMFINSKNWTVLMELNFLNVSCTKMNLVYHRVQKDINKCASQNTKCIAILHEHCVAVDRRQ